MSSSDNPIRHMTVDDLPAIMQIENAAYKYPWTEEKFRRVMSNQWGVGVVAEMDGFVFGYMVYGLHSDGIHLLNIAVVESERRTGIGSLLLASIQNRLKFIGRQRIDLEVGETNLAAQVFFRDRGFKAVKVLRGFYCNDETAYRMRYKVECEQGACGGKHESTQGDLES